MSTCEACGVSISCSSGCYQVCLSDCSSCSGGCEPSTLPAFRQLALDPVEPMSTAIKVCSHELQPGELLMVLNGVLGLPLVRIVEDGDRERERSLCHEGSVAEVLEAAGFRMASVAT